MLDLNNFKPKKEPPFELADEDWVDPTSLIGKQIEISNVEDFENDKGPGMYILFMFPGQAKLHYTTTHAGGIMRILANQDLRALLADGEILPCRITRRPSKNDSAKTVWELTE